jgi:threonine dehydrogenase-like Zn-dependent dehydrogenase
MAHFSAVYDFLDEGRLTSPSISISRLASRTAATAAAQSEGIAMNSGAVFVVSPLSMPIKCSKADFQGVNDFLEGKKVRLDMLIDRVFLFDDAPAAFEYLSSGKHVGKVVIKL